MKEWACMAKLLKLLINETEARVSRNEPVGYIFDLDSTLFCVSPRTEYILKTFGKKKDIQEQFPKAAHQLEKISSSQTDWGIRSMLKRYGIVGTLSFFEKAREFWVQEFFSSNFIFKDTPYKGALEFVKKVHSIGAEVRYLTGRDEVRMKEGTLKQLEQFELPLSQADFLHMKPDTTWDDVEFKLSLLSKINVDLKNYTYFENEPVIINRVRVQHPHLSIVFADTVHSGREEVSEELPRVGFDWEE